MIYTLLGFRSDEDSLALEQQVNMLESELISIMKWPSAEDAVGLIYPLSDIQVSEIEKITQIKFPKGLDLYLAF